MQAKKTYIVKHTQCVLRHSPLDLQCGSFLLLLLIL